MKGTGKQHRKNKKMFFFQIVPGLSREVRTTLGTIPSGIPSPLAPRNDPKSESQKNIYFLFQKLNPHLQICFVVIPGSKFGLILVQHLL